ncbi:hypothetical protein SAMN05216388_104112 [Halorientalis persicus]|uniref:Uncharacterized protein n=1 Tax=Halorientalis persicus TaxID=1367881 RepID=A0A1H8VS97_9EURY|nr:hypothetical protein [Halorientalis persicus]SEP18184.1 hypothetical protein SAMN05216388_104112 [Halorientalis persicus]
MSEADAITVWPECDAAEIHSNVGTPFAPDPADTEYTCGNCGATFDEPLKREKQHPGGRRGLAGHLADEDTTLRSDGGHRLDDPLGPDPGDPAQWCRDCGRERAGMCACCGSPLCAAHLDDDYCSAHVTIDTRVGSVPACIRTLANRRVVVPDAPTFNNARPQRARLPDALITRAREHVQAALDELDQATAPTVIETLLAATDALRFGLTAPNPARRAGWLQTAAQALTQALAALDDASLQPPLTTAAARLEQLGAAADAPGGARDG